MKPVVHPIAVILFFCSCACDCELVGKENRILIRNAGLLSSPESPSLGERCDAVTHNASAESDFKRVHLVRSARTVCSSAPLLNRWNHSKAQQASATNAEAPKTSSAIRSNPLSREGAASAQIFHRRVSGSASTLRRVNDDCLFATRARSLVSSPIKLPRRCQDIEICCRHNVCWVGLYLVHRTRIECCPQSLT